MTAVAVMMTPCKQSARTTMSLGLALLAVATAFAPAQRSAPRCNALRADVIDVSETADEELLRFILGPSGKLRAPVLRSGDLLVVGFNADLYREALT